MSIVQNGSSAANGMWNGYALWNLVVSYLIGPLNR